MKPGDEFYSGKVWRRVRLIVLARDNYRCTACGVSVAGKGQARVDHRLRRSDRPDLALDMRNLRTLCSLCDAQSHREKGSGSVHREERFEPRGCGVDGWPHARKG